MKAQQVWGVWNAETNTTEASNKTGAVEQQTKDTFVVITYTC